MVKQIDTSALPPKARKEVSIPAPAAIELHRVPVQSHTRLLLMVQKIFAGFFLVIIFLKLVIIFWKKRFLRSSVSPQKCFFSPSRREKQSAIGEIEVRGKLGLSRIHPTPAASGGNTSRSEQ